jgi:hypothetical protein
MDSHDQYAKLVLAEADLNRTFDVAVHAAMSEGNSHNIYAAQAFEHVMTLHKQHVETSVKLALLKKELTKH